MKFLISESEKRRILEMHKNAIRRQYLKEAETEPGTVIAQTREQDLIDGTKGDITYIGFSIVEDPNNRQYYYTCVPSFNSSQAEIKDVNVAGAMYDGNNNLFTAADLGLKGNYTQEFRNACSNIYAVIAKKRETFCVNPKNKTKPNFAWNCPQYTDEGKAALASAEAEQQAAAQQEKLKAEKEAKIASSQAANLEASKQAIAQGDAVMAANAESFGTPFNKLFNELTDLVEGTSASNYAMGSQQDIEAKITELQALWGDPNRKGKSAAAAADPRVSYSIAKALKFIPKLIQTAKEKYPNMTATFVK